MEATQLTIFNCEVSHHILNEICPRNLCLQFFQECAIEEVCTALIYFQTWTLWVLSKVEALGIWNWSQDIAPPAFRMVFAKLVVTKRCSFHRAQSYVWRITCHKEEFITNNFYWSAIRLINQHFRDGLHTIFHLCHFIPFPIRESCWWTVWVEVAFNVSLLG